MRATIASGRGPLYAEHHQFIAAALFHQDMVYGYPGPFVYGGAAQLMQWAVIEKNDLLAQSMEVKSYFARGAVRSPDLVYPNRSWGLLCSS